MRYTGSANLRGTWLQHGQPIPDRVGMCQIVFNDSGQPFGWHPDALDGNPTLQLTFKDGAWSGWPDGVTFKPKESK